MWPFRPNPRIASYLADPTVHEAAGNWPLGSPKSFAEFLVRFDEAQARRVIEAYRTQDSTSRHDPVEDDPEWVEVIQKVDAELKAAYPKLRRGLCHENWRRKQAMLKERGVDWISPRDLNPGTLYD